MKQLNEAFPTPTTAQDEILTFITTALAQAATAASGSQLGLSAAAPAAEDESNYEKYFSPYVDELKLSFLTAFGGFDENLAEYRNADWIVFIICIIFNMIVLLNLLIAIVSQTFADMLEAKVEEEYKEKAR